LCACQDAWLQQKQGEGVRPLTTSHPPPPYSFSNRLYLVFLFCSFLCGWVFLLTYCIFDGGK
jgi:hypothetical protein